MAKSISQLQDELLGEKFIDQLRKNKNDYTNKSGLPVLKRMLVLSAANFIIRVQENLQKLGKVSTGGLLTDIKQGEITGARGKYSVTIGYPANTKSSKYYDYVNKGVKGYVSEKPDSRYKFKDYRNKKNREVIGKKFNKSLRDWIEINALGAKFEDQKKGLTKVQKKRAAVKKLADENKNKKSLAYAIGVSIKRKGLPKTGFFDKAIDQYFGKKFIESVNEAAKRDIQIYIRSTEF